MDVQATAASATSLSPAFAQIVLPPPPSSTILDASGASSPPAPASSVGAVAAPAGPNAGNSSGAGNSSKSTDSVIGPTPGLATLPASDPNAPKKTVQADQTLSGAVAKLFNAQEQNVSVSYRIEQNPNEIVTVFTDKQTGKVIVQFPSETLIALAKLFDKLDGNVVNKKV